MANAFNDTTNLTLLVETAFDRKVDWALRSMPQFRAVADKRPEAQAMPGDVVVFTIQNDLALATTPLTETVDPDAVARPAPTRVQVTLNEYGNAEITTLKLEKLAFTNVIEEQSITIARNMADSIDRLVRNVLDTSTNVLWQDDDGTIDTSDPGTLGNANGKLFAAAPALLRGASVDPRRGEYYVAYVHPDVSYDLRTETGDNGWLKPHTDGTDTAAVYAGEIGSFQGNVFIETPRCTISSGDYFSYVLGRQALAEAVAVEPHVVVGPVVDKLKRFQPVGWYGLMGWALYRPEAMYVLKTNSSIAAL
jgi:N4-gp56 family major capsid protein